MFRLVTCGSAMRVRKRKRNCKTSQQIIEGCETIHLETNCVHALGNSAVIKYFLGQIFDDTRE